MRPSQRLIPTPIKTIYLRLRERGVTRRDACRICELPESTVRDHEKADPELAKAEEMAVRGRATVHALICQKAYEAIKDPHGKNAVHWANWLLRVYNSPLPPIGEDGPTATDGDGRVVVNLINIVQAVEDRRARTIEASPPESRRMLAHEPQVPAIVDLEPEPDPDRPGYGDGRAASD